MLHQLVNTTCLVRRYSNNYMVIRNRFSEPHCARELAKSWCVYAQARSVGPHARLGELERGL